MSIANCPVCFGPYKDPRILQCGHNLCLACIQKLVDFSELQALIAEEEARNDRLDISKEEGSKSPVVPTSVLVNGTAPTERSGSPPRTRELSNSREHKLRAHTTSSVKPVTLQVSASFTPQVASTTLASSQEEAAAAEKVRVSSHRRSTSTSHAIKKPENLAAIVANLKYVLVLFCVMLTSPKV